MNPKIACWELSVFLVWEKTIQGVSQVFFNRSTDGGSTWLPQDVLLSHTAYMGGRIPEIVCEGTNLFVAWEGFNVYGHRFINSRRSLDGGATWLPEVRVDTAVPLRSFRPKIARSGSHVFVVYESLRLAKKDIYFNHSSDHGMTWFSNDRRLDLGDIVGSHDSLEPVVACDSANTVSVAWTDTRNGSEDIYFNRTADGGSTWLTQDIRLDKSDIAGMHRSITPLIASRNGHVHVAWNDNRHGPFDVYWAGSADQGMTFSQDMRVRQGPPTSPAVEIQLALSGSNVCIGWTDARHHATQRDVFMRISHDDGVSWLDETRLDEAAPGQAGSSMLRMAASGNNVFTVRVETPPGSIFFNSTHN